MSSPNSKKRKHSSIFIPSEEKITGEYLPLNRPVPIQRVVRHKQNIASLPKPSSKPPRFPSSEPITIAWKMLSPESPTSQPASKSSTQKTSTTSEYSSSEEYRSNKRVKRVTSDDDTDDDTDDATDDATDEEKSPKKSDLLETTSTTTHSSSVSSTILFDPARFKGDFETLASRRERRNTSSTESKIHAINVKRGCEKCGGDVGEKEEMYNRYCKNCCGNCEGCGLVIFHANDGSLTHRCEKCSETDEDVQICDYPEETVGQTSSSVLESAISLTAPLTALLPSPLPAPLTAPLPSPLPALHSTPLPPQSTSSVPTITAQNAVQLNTPSTSLMSTLPLRQKMKLAEAMLRQHKDDPELESCISLLFQ